MQKKFSIKKTSFIILASVLLPFALLAGCTQQTTSSGPNAISIQDFSFNPSSLTVSVGTTVNWTNNGNVAHTVTSDTNIFDSGQISPGAGFSYTFNESGTFNYHCNNHPDMHGTIIVQ